MPTTLLRPVLQAALAGTRHGLLLRTDAELLAAFASEHDEDAFAEIVRRHGALVRGAARRMTRGAGVAEDVFQATFLLLARKASAVSWGPTVGPWLYQATRRLAAKARVRAARRRRLAPLGADVPAPETDPSAGLAWAEVRAALDCALASLPARLRDPLVLCYLQGLTQDEAAAVLGCSPAAVKGRVKRGRERLRRLLDRRGLSLSAVLAATLVGESAVAADVVTATARAAAVFRATGAATPAVRALLSGAPIAWKLAAGLVGLVLACTAGALGLAREQAGEPSLEERPPVTAKGEPTEPAVDALGDPLPAGAVARLGTRRLCGVWEPSGAVFSPDGTKVATGGSYGLSAWDAATGRPLLQRTDYRVAGNALGWRADGTGVAVVKLNDGSYFVSAFTDPREERPTPPPPEKRPEPPVPNLDYLTLSPDATRLAVVRTPGEEQFKIDVLPATTGKAVADLKAERTLGPFPGPCRDVRYTANGLLVTLRGSQDEKGDWSVAVIDPEKNAVVRTARIPAPASCPWQYMISLSADARLAAIGPRTKGTNNCDGTLRVWDLATGKELWSFPFPKGWYGTGHAFAPDGKRLVTSAGEHYFQVWDLATGREAARSPVPLGPHGAAEASAVAFSPDGKRFATARRDGRLDLWDTATGKAGLLFAAHRDAVRAVAVSPDGRLAATLGFDESVRVWELATGKSRCEVSAPLVQDTGNPYMFARRLAFTPDGRGLLFSKGGELAMADPATGRPLDLPEGMRGRPGNVREFTADGKTLATFADDVVTLWDWPAGTARVTVTVPLAPNKLAGPKEDPEVAVVWSVALSPDGRWLFTNSIRRPKDGGNGYQNGNDVWDARTGKHLHRLTTPETNYPPAAFAPDGRVLYLGGHVTEDPGRGLKRTDALTAWGPADGKFLRRFADADPDRKIRRFELDGRTVGPVTLSPDGRVLAVCEKYSTDAGVWLYETASGMMLTKLTGHGSSVNDLAFSPDGRRLVSVSADHTGLVWDVTPLALGGARGGKPGDAWERLAEPDPGLAYAAIASLAATPADAMPLLRARLRAAPVPTEADLDRVVRQLDADAFADREKASAELERFGPNAVAGVKARVGTVTSEEVRKRLTRFLGPYDGSEPSPYHLRCVRGIAALEAMDTAETRALLAELAKGPADDVLTREARAAQRRSEK
jgi:RNA polymerase sigma factor (sigma-70 family)